MSKDQSETHNKFSPMKYKPREPYPEVRPGVKVCDECGKEFFKEVSDGEGKAKQYEHVWKYKRYCDDLTDSGYRRCQRKSKARGERARLLEQYGTSDPYRDRKRQLLRERQAKHDAFTTEGHGAEGISARVRKPGMALLGSLPPEAKTNSLRQAFVRAANRHEDFIDILGQVYKEQRGFKTRVRNEIKERRRAA